MAAASGSAGGGHAAMLSIAARNRGEVSIAFQMLLYPMLDDRTVSSREMPPHIGTIIWNAADNRFGWSALLGQEPGGRIVPAGAVRARERDLAGLLPTFIGIGSLDLFVEENIEFARRLTLAGVPTELHVVPGAFHGFEVLGGEAAIAKEFDATMLRAFRRALC